MNTWRYRLELDLLPPVRSFNSNVRFLPFEDDKKAVRHLAAHENVGAIGGNAANARENTGA
jgi:hypothetical protein